MWYLSPQDAKSRRRPSVGPSAACNTQNLVCSERVTLASAAQVTYPSGCAPLRALPAGTGRNMQSWDLIVNRTPAGTVWAADRSE